MCVCVCGGAGRMCTFVRAALGEAALLQLGLVINCHSKGHAVQQLNSG
jgi:hypothetical protein